MAGKGRYRSLIVLAVAVAVATVVAIVASQGRSRHSASERYDARKEAAFEHNNGLEAERRGPQNPAAEQVEDRAYPRSYVDDRLALRSRAAFERKPDKLGRASFGSQTGFATALAASPGHGPRSAPSRRSGRGVAVLRSRQPDWPVDPGVRARDRARDRSQLRQGLGSCRRSLPPLGCRRRRRDLAHEQRARRHADLDRTAGRPAHELVRLADHRPERLLRKHALRRLGRAERLSGDSEAGLGLFKSTDGGGSWQLVGGSQAVSINRVIGAIAIKPGDPSTIYIGTDVARHGSSAANGGRRTRRHAACTSRLTAARTSPSPPTSRRDAAESSGPEHRRRLVPGRDHEDRARSEPPQRRLRGRRRLWPLTVERRRDHLDAGLSHAEPERLRARRRRETRSGTASSLTPSTSAPARRASSSATRPTTCSRRASGAPTMRPRSRAIRPAPTRTPAGASCPARRTGRTVSWPTTTARTANAATTTSSRAPLPSSAWGRVTRTSSGSAAR